MKDRRVGSDPAQQRKFGTAALLPSTAHDTYTSHGYRGLQRDRPTNDQSESLSLCTYTRTESEVQKDSRMNGDTYSRQRGHEERKATTRQPYVAFP